MSEGGRLFVWGKVTKNEAEEPLMQPTPVPFFFNVPVKQVATGHGFTAILTEENEVFTMGSRSWYMPDDHGDDQDDANTIVHWKELSNKMVCELACGSNFVVALTSVGLLYSWGTGTFGQLGLGEQLTKKVSKPTMIESLIDVSEISCGEEIVAAINDTGKVFTWGKGASGALGQGNESNQFIPKQVASLDNELIVQIKCGVTHMACISENKEIYTWGNNFLGPLGRILDNQADCDFLPGLVELVQVGALVTEENLKQSDEVEFVQVECLRYNTVALTSEGHVFTCGKGGSDGSGHGTEPHTLFCVVEQLADKTVHSIFPASSCHVAAMVEDETGVRPYVWGNGDDGKLGNGNSKALMHPTLLDLQPARDCHYISCGETHCAAVMQALESDVNPDPSIEFFIETNADEEEGIVTIQTGAPVSVSKQTVDKDDDSSGYDSNDEDDEEDEDSTPMIITELEPTPLKNSSGKEPSLEPATPTTATASPTATASTSTPAKVTPASTSSAKQTVQSVTGFLNKKGDKGLVKLWKKRWFVMDSTQFVYYTKENGSKKGSIVIEDIMDLLPGQIKYGFNLMTRNGRIYELQATSQDEFTKWTKAIKVVLEK